jgi:hypothetical protein
MKTGKHTPVLVRRAGRKALMKALGLTQQVAAAG